MIEERPASELQMSRDMDVCSRQVPNGRVLELTRKNALEKTSLEEWLGAALQATDAELGEILREIDKIFSVLKLPRLTRLPCGSPSILLYGALCGRPSSSANLPRGGTLFRSAQTGATATIDGFTANRE